MKQICVIGIGYVGIVTGACFADLGNRVVALDVNEQRIENLKKGIMPIYEPGLDELVKRNVKAGRLTFTTSYEEAVKDAEYAFIAVGTPSGAGGEADLQYVAAAATSIAKAMTAQLIIINKSTVPIGTGDWVADIVDRLGLGSFHNIGDPVPSPDRLLGRVVPRVPARRFGHRRLHESAPHGDRLHGS